MKIRLFILVFLLLLVGYSCKETGYPKPKGLVGEKQMVDMLFDIHMNEAYYNNEQYEDSLRFNSTDLHFSVLKKYGVADSVFYQSILYYSCYPKVYSKIYQQVVDRLVMIQEENNKKEEVQVAE